MSSISERLTRSYCLFHWLQLKPIPDPVRSSIAYNSLIQELRSLKIKPEDLAAVSPEGTENFEESRLAFMVRYSGLTWSTCSIFCDAIENNAWLQEGTPFLVQFNGIDATGHVGMPRSALRDFVFMKPRNVWVNNNRVLSFTLRWGKHETQRIERFVRLTSARYGLEATISNIEQSEKFIAAIKAMVGAQ